MNARQRRKERRRRDQLQISVAPWLWPRGTKRVTVYDEVDYTHVSLNRDGTVGLGGYATRWHYEYRGRS